MSDEFEYYEEDFEHVPKRRILEEFKKELETKIPPGKPVPIKKRTCSTDEYNKRLEFKRKHPPAGGNMYTTSEVMDIVDDLTLSIKEEIKEDLLKIAREADLNPDKIEERIKELKEEKRKSNEGRFNCLYTESDREFDVKIKRKQGILDLLRRIEKI